MTVTRKEVVAAKKERNIERKKSGYSDAWQKLHNKVCKLEREFYNVPEDSTPEFHNTFWAEAAY